MIVREVDDNFVVHAELPGVSKDCVNGSFRISFYFFSIYTREWVINSKICILRLVDIRDNNLIISGENKQEEGYNTATRWVQERRFGRFQVIYVKKKKNFHDVVMKLYGFFYLLSSLSLRISSVPFLFLVLLIPTKLMPSSLTAF